MSFNFKTYNCHEVIVSVSDLSKLLERDKEIAELNKILDEQLKLSSERIKILSINVNQEFEIKSLQTQLAEKDKAIAEAEKVIKVYDKSFHSYIGKDWLEKYGSK